MALGLCWLSRGRARLWAPRGRFLFRGRRGRGQLAPSLGRFAKSGAHRCVIPFTRTRPTQGIPGLRSAPWPTAGVWGVCVPSLNTQVKCSLVFTLLFSLCVEKQTVTIWAWANLSWVFFFVINAALGCYMWLLILLKGYSRRVTYLSNVLLNFSCLFSVAITGLSTTTWPAAFPAICYISNGEYKCLWATMWNTQRDKHKE